MGGIRWDDYNSTHIYNLTTQQNNDDIMDKLNDAAEQDYGDFMTRLQERDAFISKREHSGVAGTDLAPSGGIICRDGRYQQDCQSYFAPVQQIQWRAAPHLS